MEKESIWQKIIKIVITVLTAIATTFGVQACIWRYRKWVCISAHPLFCNDASSGIVSVGRRPAVVYVKRGWFLILPLSSCHPERSEGSVCIYKCVCRFFITSFLKMIRCVNWCIVSLYIIRYTESFYFNPSGIFFFKNMFFNIVWLSGVYNTLKNKNAFFLKKSL